MKLRNMLFSLLAASSMLLTIVVLVINASGTTPSQILGAPSQPPSQVIANWDVVPFQIFSDTFKVGVVAFHESGVDVTFSVNGGPDLTVNAPTYNERTDVYEYWIELNASDYADGPITIDATAAPDDPASFSRTLDTITLFADSGETVQNTAVSYADCNNGNDQTGDGSFGNPYASVKAAYNAVGEGELFTLRLGIAIPLTAI